MVLLIIADHASDDGTEAWPSQATIATKASISIRTVQRAVNSLVAAGYLWMEKGAGGSANCREDRRPHRYTINIKRLRGDTESTREERSDIDDINEATLTTPTGRQSRPMNHPNKPSNETPEFDLFWKAYPIKVGKAAALKAWIKAVKVDSADVIIAGAIRYADDPNRHPSFTAHAATWLNAHRWNDSPLPPRVLTADEKKARELEESKAKTERERQEYLKWQQEIREAEARSVPPPADIVEFLRKTLPKR
jgi:DNA-binding transcriptional regulator YhcF (GntR family)